MTNPTVWHAPTEVLERFAEDPTALDVATAGSVEAHLVSCAQCRAELAGHVDPQLVSTSWASIIDRIDRPRTSRLERLLVRLGVRSGPARLVAATPGLRASGLAAVAGLTAMAVLVADQSSSSGPFLLLAPLVPLVAIALSFAGAADPSGEAGVATPMHGAGLLLRRALAVLALTFVVLGIGAVFLLDGAAALPWIAPAAAVATLSLALGTWIRLEVALAAVGVAWVLGCASLLWLAGPGRTYLDTAPFGAPGQLTALMLAAVGTGVLLVRADRYSTMEARA